MFSQKRCKKGCRVRDSNVVPKEYVVFQNDKFFVNHFIDRPNVLGRLVVQPIRHVDSIDDLNPDEVCELFILIQRIMKSMRKVLKEEVEKVYLCSFNEDPEWHLHFHLIPRYRSEKEKGPDLLRKEPRYIPKSRIARICKLVSREVQAQ